MTELRTETLTIPTAPVGDPNPLPPLFSAVDAHQVEDAGEADAEMLRGISYGRVDSIMPYLVQDGYERDVRDQEHRVAVLENDTLRAVFLTGAGGRLWSLVHKPTDRELLFRNQVLQPANLALRNAWSAGGVEWNIGTIGHSPTTCEPLHAARLELPDGTPALRMYEFERLREVVFQVDAWLPDGSEVLLVHVRIMNPNDATVPMYWWSNIAVPQAPDVRVLAPADTAWQFTYDGGVRRRDVPVIDHDGDRTYPCRSTSAADYFFSIEGDDRRWIAALDGSGTGLAQTSTDLLRGRKLFMWGTGAGGDHWQEWLSGPGAQYLEIQAGLARTQLEHVPMPARSTWSWVEAYGLASCDPDVVHGDDWGAATNAAAAAVDALVPRRDLDRIHEEAQQWADAEPTEVLRAGSGWGALERMARAARGEDSLVLTGTPFDDSTLGAEQQVWRDLLAGSRRLDGDPAQPPRSYQRSTRWLDLLENVQGWEADLHRGVLEASEGDLGAAAREWEASVAERPSAWAYRNLGAAARSRGDLEAATAFYRAAVDLVDGVLPLTLEYVDTLLAAGAYEEALRVVAAVASPERHHGRVRLAEARAALAAGDLARVRRVLDTLVIPDLREAETTLDDLWRDLHERSGEPAPPLPRHLDFRMFATRR